MRKIIILAILIFAIVSYWVSIDSPFQFDDHKFIEQSHLTRGLDGFRGLNLKNSLLGGGRPLTLFTFALNYEFSQFRVRWYHLVNLIIHILNTLLIFFFTTELLKDKEINRNVPLGVAAVFALHPVQTESVTYIVQRAEILGSFFYIIIMLILLKLDEVNKTKKFILLFISLVLFILGWASKEIVISIPAAYLLYVLFFRGIKEFFGKLKKLSPILIVMVLFAIKFLSRLNPASHAGFKLKDISVTDYLFTQFRVMFTYLRLFILPVNQNLDYDYPVFRTFFHPEVIISFMLLSIIIAIALFTLKLKGKYSWHFRIVGFGVMWFFLLLVPTSSIVPFLDIAVEHRLYLPVFGLSLSLFTFVDLVLKKMKKEKLFIVIVLTISMLLSFLTYKRNMVWASSISLWQDTVKKSPNKARPHMNLGHAYQDSGKLELALKEYNRALELLNDGNIDRADVISNIGTIYFLKGEIDRAIKLYRDALKEYPANVGILNNLAICYIESGEPELALQYAELAVRLKPGFAPARNTLGEVYLQLNRCDEALQQFLEAKRFIPEDYRVYWNITLSLSCLKRFDEADKYFKIYMQMEPSEQMKRNALKIYEKLKQEQSS